MFYLSRRLTSSFSDIGFFNKVVTQHGARALDMNYVGGFISNERVHSYGDPVALSVHMRVRPYLRPFRMSAGIL